MKIHSDPNSTRSRRTLSRWAVVPALAALVERARAMSAGDFLFRDASGTVFGAVTASCGPEQRQRLLDSIVSTCGQQRVESGLGVDVVLRSLAINVTAPRPWHPSCMETAVVLGDVGGNDPLSSDPANCIRRMFFDLNDNGAAAARANAGAAALGVGLILGLVGSLALGTLALVHCTRLHAAKRRVSDAVSSEI